MSIEINDDLIIQWEPKIQKLLSNTYIYGWDKEDLEQELRIGILKAAKGFNEDRGVLFHTYLHTAMVNIIRTLISKAQKRLITESLDAVNEETDMLPTKILKALEDPKDMEEEVELKSILSKSKFTEQELKFIKLRLDGLTMEEISDELNDSSYKLRQSLQYKFKGIQNDEEI